MSNYNVTSHISVRSHLRGFAVIYLSLRCALRRRTGGVFNLITKDKNIWPQKRITNKKSPKPKSNFKDFFVLKIIWIRRHLIKIMFNSALVFEIMFLIGEFYVGALLIYLHRNLLVKNLTQKHGRIGQISIVILAFMQDFPVRNLNRFKSQIQNHICNIK